jgi:hypothetical protein
MSSTYSDLKFELIATGEQSGSWGSTTNTNIGTAIQQAIVGMATLTSADFTANVATLTLTNTNAAQNARALCLNIAAGAVSAAGTINVPAIQKPYIVINGSSYTVTVKVSGLTGVAVPTGKRTVIYNNGTDVGNQIDYLPSLTLGDVTGTIVGTTATQTLTNKDMTSGTNSFPTTLVTLTGTQTLTNKTLTSPAVNTGTLTNPTVTDYIETVSAIGTVTSSSTLSLSSGTVLTATLTASTACTFTMPTATAGKSFVLLLKQAASTGNGTATFTGVKWSSNGAPTITATAGKMDILTFVADGTNWYGSFAQGYTP